MKKVLSILITLLLMMSCFVMAFAEDETEENTTEAPSGYKLVINTGGHGNDIVLENLDPGGKVNDYVRQAISSRYSADGSGRYFDKGQVLLCATDQAASNYWSWEALSSGTFTSETLKDDTKVYLFWANVIKEISVNINAPVAGDKVEASPSDWSSQTNRPKASVASGAKYEFQTDKSGQKAVYWSDYRAPWSGTFKENSNYVFLMKLQSTFGNVFLKGPETTVKINGSVPEYRENWMNGMIFPFAESVDTAFYIENSIKSVAAAAPEATEANTEAPAGTPEQTTASSAGDTEEPADGAGTADTTYKEAELVTNKTDKGSQTEKKGMSPAAIAGIVVASAAALGGAAFVIVKKVFPKK